MDIYMDGHGGQPGPTREGARGAQRTYWGGPEKGYRGKLPYREGTGRPYREGTGQPSSSLRRGTFTWVEVDTGDTPLVRCAAHTPDRVPLV